MAKSKIGDIYEAKNDQNFRYFQLAAIDPYQLNNDVVAIFQGEYAAQQSPKDVMAHPVDFYSHTMVDAGTPEYWQKIGHAEPVSTKGAVFKDVDLDDSREQNEANASSSEHWMVWRIGEGPKYVGRYEKVPEEAELGHIFNPKRFANRICIGEYGGDPYYGVKR